jgi:hypothetical protein
MEEMLKSFWIENQPSLWDLVVFEVDSTLPVLKLPFHGRYRGRIGMKVDQQEAIDSEGGATRSSGTKGASVEFTLLLFEPQHLVFYATLIRALQARKSEGKKPAVTVRHPALNVLGIERLLFKSATLPTRSSAKEVLTSTLSFVEELSKPPSPPAEKKEEAKDEKEAVPKVEPPSTGALKDPELGGAQP